jgi:predicted PurR-regulated permease PerM
MDSPDWRGRYVAAVVLLVGGVLVAYLCFRLFQPFVGPTVWAVVLAVLLHPFQEPLARRLRSRSLAAVLLCVAGFLAVGLPFFYLVSSLPAEIKQAYGMVDAALRPDPSGKIGEPRLLRAWNWVAEAATKAGYDLPTALSDLLRHATSRLVALIPRLIGEAFEYLFDFAMTFLTLFFFLRDGDRLLHWLRGLVPLGHEQADELFGKIRDVVRASVFGGLAVALAQGFAGGLLFWALRLPTPLLWGSLMGTLSLLPPLGAWLVWVPGGGILILQGHPVKGVILLAGGALGISLIDNVLRPILIGQRTQIPTLLLFFSLIGGFQFFGPVGLIVGPVLVALLIGILDFVRLRVQRQTDV